MDDEKFLMYIGVGLGVAVFISVLFLLLIYLYIRRRNASQLREETEDTQMAASEKVLIEKAEHAHQGELGTQKTETSPQNGSAGNPQNTPDATSSRMTQSYEEIEIGSFPNQQENGIVDAIPPSTDDADMKDDAATSPSQNEGASTDDGPHLTEENNMYVSADEVKLNQRNPDEANDVEGDSVASPSQNEDAINTNDDSYSVEENKMYVSVEEVKLNKKPSVMHYKAESGDIYAGVVKL